MNKSIGFTLLYFSVALYLFATGILGLAGNNYGEISLAVRSLNITGDFYRILVIVLSLLAMAAGIFILLKFFGISISSTETLLLILAATWAVFIVMRDIIPLFRSGIDFKGWLGQFGYHVMALSGILLSTERFGG